MPSVTALEAGTCETFDFTFFGSTSGTVSSDTGVVHTGPRSLKLSTSSPATVAFATLVGSLADAGRRISWWVQLSTTTPAATTRIASIQTSGGVVIARLRITATGTLLLDNVTTTIASGSTVLNPNIWYRLGISYTITSTTNYQFTVYINGVQEFIGTAGPTLPASASNIFVPVIGNEAGANVNAWISGIYIDDGSDFSDPGNVDVMAKRPFANGTTNGFTTQIGSGGSGYGSGHAPQVNERPLNTNNGWSMIGSGSAVTEEYNIEGKTVGDSDLTSATIAGVRGWVFAKSALAETGQIIVDGTNINISLSNTFSLFSKNSNTPTVYPAGTGSDIGIITSTTVTTVSLYECGILVAFIRPPDAQDWFGAIPSRTLLSFPNVGY